MTPHNLSTLNFGLISKQTRKHWWVFLHQQTEASCRHTASVFFHVLEILWCVTTCFLLMSGCCSPLNPLMVISSHNNIQTLLLLQKNLECMLWVFSQMLEEHTISEIQKKASSVPWRRRKRLKIVLELKLTDSCLAWSEWFWSVHTFTDSICNSWTPVRGLKHTFYRTKLRHVVI